MSKLEELLSSAADPTPTDRRRRRFLSSMVGAASLSLLGCSRSGDEGETDEGAPEPEREPPSMVASYQPRFDRVHSQSTYRAIASKSAALAVVERSSRDAIVNSTLTAVERDWVFNDFVSSDSRLDTGDMDVIREFPEFVALALGAVEAKQNLAAGWADDGDYVATLRALNRVVSG